MENFIFRSSLPEMFYKKVVLINFAKSTSESLFNKVHFLNKFLIKTSDFTKKEIPTRVFSCEFCEIVKNTFFTKYLLVTASGIYFYNFNKKQDRSLVKKCFVSKRITLLVSEAKMLETLKSKDKYIFVYFFFINNSKLLFSKFPGLKVA